MAIENNALNLGGASLTYVSNMSEEDIEKYAQEHGLVYNSITRQFWDPESDSYTNLSDVEAELSAQGQDGGPEDSLSDASDAQKNSMWSNIGSGIKMVDSMINSSSNIDEESSFASGLKTGYHTAADVLGQVNPMLGAIGQGAATVLDAIDQIGARRSDKFSVDTEMADTIGGSYSGSLDTLEKAEANAGKKYGLFSNGARKRANKAIAKATQLQNQMQSISDEVRQQNDLVNAMGDQASNVYAFETAGGFDPRYARVGESGGKLNMFVPDIIERFVPEIIVPGAYRSGGVLGQVISPNDRGIVKWTPDLSGAWFPDIVATKQTGGKLGEQLDAPEVKDTVQKSVIPEGSLHKNKHHMENTDGMTKKGIPVVDDNDKQQAEIERNEIIFTKEVTTKLEELYKIYYDENSSEEEKTNAAIDAGKLLTKEIMLNTDDRTGLISTLQQGGTIGKQPYEEWVKDVNPDFVNDNYDLKTAYQYLPIETLDLWKSAVNMSTPPKGTAWHLPSIQQIDDDTYIFLKKGRTAKENPELQYEFDAYTERPDFVNEFKMKFDKDNNRWTYIRRHTK